MSRKKDNSSRGNNYFSASDYPSDIGKIIQTLTFRAMDAGNHGDFKVSFLNMEVALWLSQNLEKRCLEAVMLNNLGLLYTLEGSWDKAMLSFDRSMEIAINSCPSNDNFLATLKKNIVCLFDPKSAPPKSLDNGQ